MSAVLDKTRARSQAQETSAETEDYQQRLELLYDIAQQASSPSEVSKLLEEILGVTQRLIHASASSLLLIDQEKGELYFQVAEGKAANTLRQMRLGIDSGIAGWVVLNSKPLVINDVTTDKRFNKHIDEVTGFVTKSIIAVPVMRGQKVIGVLELLNKADGGAFTEQDLAVLTGFASTEAIVLLLSMAATAINNIKLCQAVQNGFKSTVETLVAATDAKDPYAYGHSRRVKEYALLAASSLPLSPEELRVLEFGALLHDIGKIGIDDSILRKSDPLTDKDWYIMRKHPLKGANVVGEIPFLEKARDIVLYHHERYDGTGYPAGLKGEKIPIGARLVAVADAFDTMTTDRSYRATLSMYQALSELNQNAGTQFCPVAVEAFVSGFMARNEKLVKHEAEQAAKEQAKREAEAARGAKGAEALARQEAKRAAKEQAKREAEAARRAKKAEALARQEAKRATKEAAKREAEAARRAKEAEALARQAAKEKTKAEAAVPDIGSEIYEGDVRLLLPSSLSFNQVMQFKRRLEKVKSLRILMLGGSVDEGNIVVVSVQKPVNLIGILSKIPTVEKVEKKGNNIVVTLETSAANTNM